MSETPQSSPAETANAELNALLNDHMPQLEAMLDAHAEQFGHEPGLRDRLYEQLQSILADQREHEFHTLEGDALRRELLLVAQEFLDGYFLEHPDHQDVAQSTIEGAVSAARSDAASILE